MSALIRRSPRFVEGIPSHRGLQVGSNLAESSRSDKVRELRLPEPMFDPQVQVSAVATTPLGSSRPVIAGAAITLQTVSAGFRSSQLSVNLDFKVSEYSGDRGGTGTLSYGGQYDNVIGELTFDTTSNVEGPNSSNNRRSVSFLFVTDTPSESTFLVLERGTSSSTLRQEMSYSMKSLGVVPGKPHTLRIYRSFITSPGPLGTAYYYRTEIYVDGTHKAQHNTRANVVGERPVLRVRFSSPVYIRDMWSSNNSEAGTNSTTHNVTLTGKLLPYKDSDSLSELASLENVFESSSYAFFLGKFPPTIGARQLAVTQTLTPINGSWLIRMSIDGADQVVSEHRLSHIGLPVDSDFTALPKQDVITVPELTREALNELRFRLEFIEV